MTAGIAAGGARRFAAASRRRRFRRFSCPVAGLRDSLAVGASRGCPGTSRTGVDARTPTKHALGGRSGCLP